MEKGGKDTKTQAGEKLLILNVCTCETGVQQVEYIIEEKASLLILLVFHKNNFCSALCSSHLYSFEVYCHQRHFPERNQKDNTPGPENSQRNNLQQQFFSIHIENEKDNLFLTAFTFTLLAVFITSLILPSSIL